MLYIFQGKGRILLSDLSLYSSYPSNPSQCLNPYVRRWSFSFFLLDIIDVSLEEPTSSRGIPYSSKRADVGKLYNGTPLVTEDTRI